MRRSNAFLFSLSGLALALLALTPVANAQIVVHDNFGPGDTYDNGTAWTESGLTAIVGTQSAGSGFTTAVSGNLFDISVAIGNVTGTNVAHVFLSDGTSGVPGTVLESWTITNLPGLGSGAAPTVLTSVLNPMLSAGTTYYLYEAEDGDTWNGWAWNTTGDVGLIFSGDNVNYSSDNTDPSIAYRVRIEGTAAVPEPGSAALLAGMGLSGAGLLIRRKRAE